VSSSNFDSNLESVGKQSAVVRFTKLLLISIVLSTLLLYWIVPPISDGGLEVGATAPPINALEWVNGQPSEDTSDKVIVVNAWATWCINCVREMPELVETQRRFKDRNVQFIGLTAESLDSSPKVKDFLLRTNVTWPNGVAATNTLIGFKAEAIPAVWVITPDGKVVWNYDSGGTLDDGIEMALKRASL